MWIHLSPHAALINLAEDNVPRTTQAAVVFIIAVEVIMVLVIEHTSTVFFFPFDV